MNTIIAAFSDSATAQEALELLRMRGVNDVQLLTHQDGNIIDRLRRYDVPSERAQLYAEVMRRGAPLVVAQTQDDDAQKIAKELDDLGSLDLDAASSRWRQQGWNGYDSDALPYDAEASTDEQRSLREESLGRESLSQRSAGTQNVTKGGDVDVIEEQVAIGKREVSRGGVRVRTYVVERPIREQVQLHEERIDVAREPVDERISPQTADSTFTEDEFVVTARGEEAVVGKEARVVERVHVGKTSEDRTETIEETERRREVEVEPIQGDENRRGGGR